MAPPDLYVRNGLVVTSGGSFEGGVLVAGAPSAFRAGDEALEGGTQQVARRALTIFAERQIMDSAPSGQFLPGGGAEQGTTMEGPDSQWG